MFAEFVPLFLSQYVTIWHGGYNPAKEVKREVLFSLYELVLGWDLLIL